MTSSNGSISALLAICAGNSPVPVNSPHKGQWRGALMFSMICAWINGWVNNREAGDLRRHRAHYDVTVMSYINVEIRAWISKYNRVRLEILLHIHVLVWVGLPKNTPVTPGYQYPNWVPIPSRVFYLPIHLVHTIHYIPVYAIQFD